MKVGIIGWRGMVGSVLMQRMREEDDFSRFDAVFFSTSQAGQEGPKVGGTSGLMRHLHFVWKKTAPSFSIQ